MDALMEAARALGAFASGALVIAVILAIVVVPPAGVAWLAGRADAPDGSAAKWLAVRCFLVALVLLGASGFYTSLNAAGLGRSALLFTGLPALLAAGLIAVLDFRSPARAIFGGITAFLAISVLWLREGIICVIIAAPLFYLVAFATLALARRWYRRGRRADVSVAVVALVLLASFEGTSAGLSLPREQSVEVVARVDLPAATVRANLAAHPDLDRLPLAPVLELGFPVPVTATGEGLAPGDVRRFGFRRLDGTVDEVAFEVTAARARGVTLEPIHDATPIARWLGWRGTRIDWTPVDATRTEVRVRMAWERRLDPAWYFAPVQRFVVGRAARVLIAHAGQSAAAP